MAKRTKSALFDTSGVELARPAERWLPDVIERTRYDVADRSLAAALHVGTLPWHHKAPFDRLPIAQALEQGHPIVSRDAELDAYGVPGLRA